MSWWLSATINKSATWESIKNSANANNNKVLHDLAHDLCDLICYSSLLTPATLASFLLPHVRSRTMPVHASEPLPWLFFLARMLSLKCLHGQLPHFQELSAQIFSMSFFWPNYSIPHNLLAGSPQAPYCLSLHALPPYKLVLLTDMIPSSRTKVSDEKYRTSLSEYPDTVLLFQMSTNNSYHHFLVLAWVPCFLTFSTSAYEICHFKNR